MFVNKRLILIQVLLALSVVQLHAFNYGSDDVVGAEITETGKPKEKLVIKTKIRDETPNLVATSLTNKEYVFGEDDDEEEEKEETKSNVVASGVLDSENMSEKTALPASIPAAPAAHEDASKSQLARPAEQQQEQHHNVKKSIDSEEEAIVEKLIEDEIEKLRKQRVDEAFLTDFINQDDMKEFHSKADLQRRLLHDNDNRYDFDYEQMILDQLKKNERGAERDDAYSIYDVSSLGSDRDQPLELSLSDYLDLIKDDNLNDLDSTNMNTNEFGKSATELLKARLLENKQKTADLLKQSQSSMANSEQQQSIQKPVVNKYEYKEKSLSENEYNKNLKLGKKDPFFNTKVLTESDLEWTNQNLISVPNNVDAQPNKAQKNLNTQHVGDTYKDKIDIIKKQNDYLFIFIVASCSIAGVIAIVGAGFCYFSMHRNSKSAVNIEYGIKSGFSSQGSVKSTSSGDRRLAQSAQMYHYQHQKQQMIAMEKASNDTKADNSDNSDVEEGDYTVYECPGLAPTGEMEVKNPLFKEDFSASTNNLNSSPPFTTTTHSGLPPAYSTVEPKVSPSSSKIDLNKSNVSESTAQNGSPLIPLIDDSTLNDSTLSTLSSNQNDSASAVPAEKKEDVLVTDVNENATVPKQ